MRTLKRWVFLGSHECGILSEMRMTEWVAALSDTEDNGGQVWNKGLSHHKVPEEYYKIWTSDLN